jgi:hypothetical protein
LFSHEETISLFGWLVPDGWCWFVLREEYCWLVAGGWFVLREKYCWLVADKPSEQAVCLLLAQCTRNLEFTIGKKPLDVTLPIGQIERKRKQLLEQVYWHTSAVS